MKNDRKNDLTKVTAKLFAPMYARFDTQLSEALLRRDAFIDRMIANEVPHLRQDLAGKRLSPEANRYISQSLKKMGTQELEKKSISIRHSTADALKEAVDEHNLVRDAFLNLLIALLRSTDSLLEQLGLPSRITMFRRDGTEDMPTSPLIAITEIQWDPLYYLRAACEKEYGCGLYALALPLDMHGFACYLPDEDVPGMPANAEKLAREKSMSDLINSVELPPIAAKPT